MGGFRRNMGGTHVQDPRRTRSLNRKPPLGKWQPTVPSWEKKFCSSIGLIPWRKLLEAKRFMHLHSKVIQWNDSAGEEAFSNAKKRFYAEINGLPCDIPLPDPDKYIDEADWNSVVDPKLLSDLENGRSEVVDEEDGSGRVIIGSVLLNQSFGCTGWGDTEEAFCKDSNNLCSVPDFGNSDPKLLSDMERGCSAVVDEEDRSGRVIFGSVQLNQSFGCSGCGDTEEAFRKDSNDLCPVLDFGNSDLKAGGMEYSGSHHPPESNIPIKASGWGNHRNDCNWNNWNNLYQLENVGECGGAWDWNSQRKREVAGDCVEV